MHNTLFYRIKDIFTKTGASWDQLAPSKDTVQNALCTTQTAPFQI